MIPKFACLEFEIFIIDIEEEGSKAVY